MPVRLPYSIVGVICAAIYLPFGIWVVQDELRHSGGGWINLRGMGTTLATAPSQLTLGWLLRALGVPKVNFNTPGVAGYLELFLHLALTALVVYCLGAGLEWIARRVTG